MLPRLTFVVVLIWIFLAPFSASAVIVETRSGDKIRGHLIEKNQVRVVVRLDGQEKTKTIERNNILNIVETVNIVRLNALDPKDPKSYRIYAEELAAQRNDPEARDMALRLFLIAAYLDPRKQGYNCLMRMSNLARNSDEARSFRAMAYLLDLLHDKSTLEKKSPGSGGSRAREKFLQALNLFRRGKTKTALELASEKGVADYFSIIPGLLSYQEFVRICKENPECSCKTGRIFCRKCLGKNPLCPACKGKGWNFCKKCKGKPRFVPISPLQERLMLRLELLYETNPGGNLNSSTKSHEKRWSRIIANRQLQPVPVLSLFTITEFDPRNCVHKNGKWVKPG